MAEIPIAIGTPTKAETIQVSGEGDNTVNIVKKTIECRNERQQQNIKPQFDEVWAVFDKDDFPEKDYNEAMRLGRQEKIEIAYSNQSFELWYVLHFQYLDTALHRKDYIKILSKQLKFKYKKSDEKVVDFLFKNCKPMTAIKRAEKLEENYHRPNHAKACPSTRVHKLVKSLFIYCHYEED